MAVFGNKQIYQGGGSFGSIPGVTDELRKDMRPKSWEEKRDESLRHALEKANLTELRAQWNPEPDPEFDWAKKAEQLAYHANRVRMKTALQRAQNRNIAVANSTVNIPNINLGGGGGKFADFIRAIAGKESGGNYGAVNADSGALGKYQIIPSNIAGSGRGWDYEALGRDISTQQFLNNPRLQEKIARAKLRQYYNQHGAAGAASAWYSGDPNKINDRNAQGKYPSIYEYVQDILRAMGR